MRRHTEPLDAVHDRRADSLTSISALAHYKIPVKAYWSFFLCGVDFRGRLQRPLWQREKQR